MWIVEFLFGTEKSKLWAILESGNRKEGWNSYKSGATQLKFCDPVEDPLFGFPNGRKERLSRVTVEEMILARVPPTHMGFCAAEWLDMEKCRDGDKWTFFGCREESAKWTTCVQEDHLLRMKEQERNRRLIARARRIAAKNAETDLDKNSEKESLEKK